MKAAQVHSMKQPAALRDAGQRPVLIDAGCTFVCRACGCLNNDDGGHTVQCRCGMRHVRIRGELVQCGR